MSNLLFNSEALKVIAERTHGRDVAEWPHIAHRTPRCRPRRCPRRLGRASRDHNSNDYNSMADSDDHFRFSLACSRRRGCEREGARWILIRGTRLSECINTLGVGSVAQRHSRAVSRGLRGATRRRRLRHYARRLRLCLSRRQSL